jgi:hypothetical protein
MKTSLESNKEKKNRNTRFITIVVLFFLGIGVLIFMNVQKNEVIEEKNRIISIQEEELSAKLTEIEGLRSELLSIKEERDKLGLSNDSLILKIDNLNAIIKDYKKKNNSLEKNKLLYETQIVELRRDRDRLLKEIEEVKYKNESLKKEVELLGNEKLKLSDSLLLLKQKEAENEAKIAIASALKVEDFKIEVMDEKGKIREGKEFKSKRIDKLKITFKISDNKIAKHNTKTVYMRLIEPTGAAVYDLSVGGGSFESKDDGRLISYTAKQTIEFDNSNQEVSFVYSKGSEYLKGMHRIQIYIDGFLSGETSFVVR